MLLIRDGMKVRLTKKLAEQLDGIDLSDRRAGETFDLPIQEARLLMAEAWAAPERRDGWPSASDRRSGVGTIEQRSAAQYRAASDSKSGPPWSDRRVHCRRDVTGGDRYS